MVATLAFENPEFVFLYRGQRNDYLERGATTLYPSLFRNQKPRKPLADQLDVLLKVESALTDEFDRDQQPNLSRNQLVRWAVLQHYEVCPTPLLDLTHSLHVAASFAFDGRSTNADECYLFVLGLPQISGSITVVSDQELQIVRLSSVCPPNTLRPYFQEGYLIGTFPSMDVGMKQRFRHNELDCASRLIAKFRLQRTGFWNQSFTPLSNQALYPNESNEFNERIRLLTSLWESA